MVIYSSMSMSILLYPMITIVGYQLWWSVSNFVDFRFCTMPSDITLSYLSLVLLSHLSWFIVLEYRTGDIANDYWECRLWAKSELLLLQLPMPNAQLARQGAHDHTNNQWWSFTFKGVWAQKQHLFSILHHQLFSNKVSVIMITTTPC